MEKTLRAASMKKALPRIIICFLLAVILLAVTGFGIFRLIGGATPLSELDADSLDGRYVSVDLSQALAGFATLSVDDEVTKEYFVLQLDDGRYMAIAGRGSYMDDLDAAGDQAEDYFVNGTVDSLTSMGTVCGTVIALDEDLEEYLLTALETMADYIPELEDVEDLESLVIYSCLEMGRVGTLQTTPVIILSVLALLFLLLAIVLLVLILTGRYQKQVHALLADADMEAVEADFRDAKRVEHVRVGKLYTWYQAGARSLAVENSQIIWAYCQIEPLVVSSYRWPLCMWLRDGSMVGPHLKDQKSVKTILATLEAGGARFLNGYTADRNQACNSNFDKFLQAADEELAAGSSAAD